jgi:hypothetical protein
MKQDRLYLIAFLEEWTKWLHGLERKTYSPDYGLCDSLASYFYSQAIYDWIGHQQTADCLRHLLVRDFEDHRFPFGGKEVFYEEVRNCSCHKNQERVQWASRILKELKEELNYV